MSIRKSYTLTLTQDTATAVGEDSEKGVFPGVTLRASDSNTSGIRYSSVGDVSATNGQILAPGQTICVKSIDPRSLGLFCSGVDQIVDVTLGPEVLVSSATASGGGGGDATAANQTAALTALDTIYDVLITLGLDATNVQIRDAVTALGDGATLADLAAAFATDAITQGDILSALQAANINLDAMKAGIDLLVPDLDAVRVATEAVASATGTTADADSANTLVGRIKNLLSRIPAALVDGRFDGNIGSWLGSTAPTVGQKTMTASLPVAIASDQSAVTINADLRVGSAAVTNANPVPTVFQNFPTFNVIALATALGNGKALISIMLNTGGTATKIRLLDVQIMNVRTTNVTGVLADIQLRRITAHSAGTDITNIVTKYDSANTLDAGITARTGAAVTTEANPLRKWFLATDEYSVGSLETESFQASNENKFPNFFFDPRAQPLIARVNEGFQILCNTNTTAGTFDVGLTFSQE